MHLTMLELPFLCCYYFVVCSMLLVISIKTLSKTLSLKYSPEQIVLARRTAPQGNLGRSLNILGSFDFGLGTDAVEGALGAGGGIAGMLRPLITGTAVGMALKSQGKLVGAGVSFSEPDFLVFFSFLICLLFYFFRCLSCLSREEELSDSLSSDSSDSESELCLFFFIFFFSDLSFFLSFFLSFSFFFFLSPIATIYNNQFFTAINESLNYSNDLIRNQANLPNATIPLFIILLVAT